MPGVSAALRVELEVDRIRELSKGGRHVEALAAAEALAVAVPENRDVLYLVAANQRCLNPIPEALATLQRILGLPLSGSTLLEQILASHSRVEGTHELYDIQRIVLEMRRPRSDLEDPRYPAVLAGLAPEDFRRLGDLYITGTRAYRQGKPFFIDKMPNNFRHIGLIHLMLPNAKIIDARREPMACCFSLNFP
jgi:hypothetical protein